MKRIILPFFVCLSLFFCCSSSQVLSVTEIPRSGYVIEDFKSEIEVNKDTSLTVVEAIKVNFFVQKHGIFRIIPVIYSAKGKTIRARLTAVTVTDENGNPYRFQTSHYNQSIKIKIGDPNKTIAGLHTYVIKYQINKVLLRYQDHDEVYWNVTGSEWDTTIKKASAKIESPLASIQKVDCFAGTTGSQQKNCTADHQDKTAQFTTTSPLSWGKDFTIVVALDKNNQLDFPGPIQRITGFLIDNWGYLVALAPLSVLFYFWYKRGRDLKYLSDNIYTKPENKKTTTAPLFSREHLPTVYSPIDGLTPAEVGTIIDEKVDIQDIVAEIIELARLGYLEIKKTETKKLLRKKIDYFFIKKNKNPTKLRDYQKYLLEKLFAANQDKVSLSQLKNKFYKHLKTFKDKLYAHLVKNKIFAGNPEKIKIKWTAIYAFLTMTSFIATVFFAVLTTNGAPVFFSLVTIIPAIYLINSMPRRTAWGHSLFRQITGLKWYLDKGKWREEIAEKHLFLEEILPLAICLGIVKKLAKQMAVLGVKPPSYFTGITTRHLYSDLNHFSVRAASNLTSAPGGTWSGKSNWSGGSGFSGGSSGGSSGGGFGGGGGGSW